MDSSYNEDVAKICTMSLLAKLDSLNSHEEYLSQHRLSEPIVSLKASNFLSCFE